jgi:hypothetical protein
MLHTRNIVFQARFTEDVSNEKVSLRVPIWSKTTARGIGWVWYGQFQSYTTFSLLCACSRSNLVY